MPHCALRAAFFWLDASLSESSREELVDALEVPEGAVQGPSHVHADGTPWPIFVPLTFVTGFLGMNFGWMVDQVDTQVAFWLLGFVVPAATAALSWRLLVRRFVMADER